MSEQDWLPAYLDRKADAFLTDMDARGIAVEPREDVRQAVRGLVTSVMGEMSIHLAHRPEPSSEPDEPDDCSECPGCERCAPWRKPRDHQVNEGDPRP